MAGGDNFERAKLSMGSKKTPADVKNDIEGFLRLYPNCNRLLSNKTEMEKRGLSKLYDIYKRRCSEHHVDRDLALLYLMLKNNKSLFTDSETLNLMSNLKDKTASQVRATNYDSYSDIVQEIVSVAQRCMRVNGVCEKLLDITDNFIDFYHASDMALPLADPPFRECIVNAAYAADYCEKIALLGIYMGME